MSVVLLVVLLLVGPVARGSEATYSPAEVAECLNQYRATGSSRDRRRLVRMLRAFRPSLQDRRDLPTLEVAVAAESAVDSESLETAQVLHWLGGRLWERGRFDEASVAALRAVEIRKALLAPGDPELAKSMYNAGLYLKEAGRYGEAEPMFRSALEVWELTLGADHPRYGRGLSALASLYQDQGRLDESEELYRQAIRVHEGAQVPEALALTRNNLAQMLVQRARYVEARALFEEALQGLVAMPARDPVDVAHVRSNLGELLATVGEFESAAPMLDAAVDELRAVLPEDHPEIASALVRRGKLNAILGRFELARADLTRAVGLLEPRGAHLRVAVALKNLAFFHEAEGHPELGAPLLERATDVVESAAGGSHPMAVELRCDLGQVYSSLHRAADARRELGVCLEERSRSLPAWHAFRVRPLVLLANLDLLDGNPDAADSRAREAFHISLRSGDPDLEHRAAQLMADLAHVRAKPDEAIFFGKLAVHAAERIAVGVGGLEQSAHEAVMRERLPTYRVLAERLLDRGRVSEADQVLALLKRHEFDLYLRGHDVGAPTERSLEYTEAEDQWNLAYESGKVGLARDGAILARLEARARAGEVLGPDEEALRSKLQADVDHSRAAFFSVLDGIREHASEGDPKLRTTIDRSGLNELDLRQSQLGGIGHAALLTTLVSNEAVHLILSTEMVHLHRSVDLPRSELVDLVARLRASLEDPSRDPRADAAVLYDVLVGPVQRELDASGATTLLVSLDDVLRYLPMSALWDGQAWLAERLELTVVTPAARSWLGERRDGEEVFLAMGTSAQHSVGDVRLAGLPGVRQELDALVRTSEQDTGLAPGTVLLDDKFTLQAVEEALAARPNVVHIASHFVFRPGSEARTFLLLGDGSALTLASLRSRRLLSFEGVDLLTLSACETGMGDATGDGAEVEGLGVLAQNRGAHSVVASLWPVDDASTAFWMVEFYRARSAGQSVAASVREAQRRMIAGAGGGVEAPGRGPRRVEQEEPDVPSWGGKGWSHPYYWAPFVLMGSPE